MRFELVMRLVVVALDNRFLDGVAHPFNLTVGPRMAYLLESMCDVVCLADAVKWNGPEASIPSRLAN